MYVCFLSLLLTRFLVCVFIFPLSALFFIPIATAHRRNDPKTLSCQDRALPSGIVLAGAGSSPGCESRAACAQVSSWVLLQS